MIISSHALGRYLTRTGYNHSLEQAVLDLRAVLTTVPYCTAEEARHLIRSSRLLTDRKNTQYKAWFDENINEWCVAVIYKNVVRTILTEVIYNKGIVKRGGANG